MKISSAVMGMGVQTSCSRRLGIYFVRVVNKALLGKSLWRVGDKSQGLWWSLLVYNYKLLEQGWKTPTSSYQASEMWKSIFSVIPEFEKWIRFRVHSRQLVSFWDEFWCGNLQLRTTIWISLFFG